MFHRVGAEEGGEGLCMGVEWGNLGGEDEDQCLDPGRGSEAQGEGQHEEECEEVVLILDPGGANVRVE